MKELFIFGFLVICQPFGCHGSSVQIDVRTSNTKGSSGWHMHGDDDMGFYGFGSVEKLGSDFLPSNFESQYGNKIDSRANLYSDSYNLKQPGIGFKSGANFENQGRINNFKDQNLVRPNGIHLNGQGTGYDTNQEGNIGYDAGMNIGDEFLNRGKSFLSAMNKIPNLLGNSFAYKNPDINFKLPSIIENQNVNADSYQLKYPEIGFNTGSNFENHGRKNNFKDQYLIPSATHINSQEAGCGKDGPCKSNDYNGANSEYQNSVNDFKDQYLVKPSAINLHSDQVTDDISPSFIPSAGANPNANLQLEGASHRNKQHKPALENQIASQTALRNNYGIDGNLNAYKKPQIQEESYTIKKNSTMEKQNTNQSEFRADHRILGLEKLNPKQNPNLDGYSKNQSIKASGNV